VSEVKQNRKQFDLDVGEKKPEAFKQLVQAPKPQPKRKEVGIKGEYDFGDSGLQAPPSKPKRQSSKQKSPKGDRGRGRPVTLTDERYRVKVPKKISPALNAKLDVLEEYITELSDISGKVRFEDIINALADTYVSKSLTPAKEEHFQQELVGALKKIK
jgi:hypothetical protein